MESRHKILESTAVVSFFTGVSRILGLARDMGMAYFFGTGLASSAFITAFRIPNLFRAILGEGALSAAFVPVLTESIEKDGEDRASQTASSIILLVAALLLMIVGCGIVVMLSLGFFNMGEKWNVTVSLAVITMPYLFFICLAAMCMGVFHSKGKFWVPAASQGLLNVVWIATLYLVCPLFGSTPIQRIYAVAWGVVVAGAVQLGFQAVFLLRMGFNPPVVIDWKAPTVRRFFALLAPVILGSGITQLNVLVSTFLALSIAVWAPAAIMFADRLVYLPLGLVATSLAAVLLPTFSKLVAAERHDEFVSMLKLSLRNICLIMTPIAAGMFAVSLPLISLAFQWNGKFDEASAIYTNRAFMVYIPGLIVFSLYKVIVPAFYAMKDTRTPVRVAIGSAILNLALNLVAIRVLPDGYKHAGLSASHVIASFLSCTVLLVVLNRKLGGIKFAHTFWSIISTLISGVIMAAVTIRAYAFIIDRFSPSDGGGKVFQLIAIAGACLLGLVIYAATRLMVSRDDATSAFKSLVSSSRR